MELALLDSKSKVSVSDNVFGIEFKEGLIHQVVTAYLTNMRAGTKAQKNRSAVSGGGAKPWRQKGTGRARAGTIRSPIWRGGGATFAATPKEYNKKVNKKAYRVAIRSILSELVRQERLIVLKNLTIEKPKTRDFLKKVEFLKNSKKTLIVTEVLDVNLILASRNLHFLEVIQASEINPLELVASEKVVVTEAALKKIEESLA